MADILPIVSVDITLETSTQTRQGFGTLLFATADRRFPEKIRTYSSITAVGEDFATTDAAYLAASAYFAQVPRPTQIKIGQLKADLVLTPTAATASGQEYSFVFVKDDGVAVEVSYTSVGADDESTIVAGLKTAMDTEGLTGNALATDDKVTTSGTTTLVLSEVNGLGFGVTTAISSNLTKTSVLAPATAAESINLFVEEDGDWYFYATDQHSASYIEAVGTAIESLTKLYFYATNAVETLAAVEDPIAANDIASIMKSKSLSRSVGVFHDDLSAYSEVAYIGGKAPYDAGSVSWANFALAGIAEPVHPTTGKRLTLTQIDNIGKRNVNVQVNKGGQVVIRLGLVANGDAISTIRGADSLQDSISVAVCNRLLGNKATRLVFDNADINVFGSDIKTVLDEYVSRGFLLDDYTITLPEASTISASDKAAGILRGIKFNAPLAAPIKSAAVQGTINI